MGEAAARSSGCFFLRTGMRRGPVSPMGKSLKIPAWETRNRRKDILSCALQASTDVTSMHKSDEPSSLIVRVGKSGKNVGGLGRLCHFFDVRGLGTDRLSHIKMPE